MPISIHNKTYFPVAERLSMAHNDKEDALQSVITDAVQVFEDGGVVFRAVVTFASGRTFTGHAYESPKSKGIAGQSPWEVAETSAVGRALGMGGYGSDDSVASADEVQRKAQPTPARPVETKPQASPADALAYEYKRLYSKAVDLGAPLVKDGHALPVAIPSTSPKLGAAVDYLRNLVAQAEDMAEEAA